MQSLKLHNKLIEYLSILKVRITSSNDFGYTDLNKGAEELYKEMLNITHGHNLIEAKASNFPAADLIDRQRGLAVQITSDNSLKNIKKRIDTFNRLNMQADFGEFTFYIIGKRSKSIKDDDIYGNIPLGTNVIDTSAFIEEVRAAQKLKEVCDYLEKELFPKNNDAENSGETINNLFSGATIQNGATVNVTTGAQHITVESKNLVLPEDKQNYPVNTFLQGSISCEALLEDKQVPSSDTKNFDYLLSQLLGKDLRDFEAFETEQIYHDLDSFKDTQYSQIANILWLLLYFESSAPKLPSLALIEQASKKKASLPSYLTENHTKLLKQFALYQASSENLLSSLPNNE